ncbi:hypothetical protein GCM10010129_58410 [Streptomyces fumigatiscleroticus]|nr:hypothetical protein GCM10010129_58410 [Streptomyces fumigatiscleroticus]
MPIVLSRARVAGGARARPAAAAAEMAAAARTDHGCVSYPFDAGLEGPEVGRSREVLDAHLAHSRTTAFLARVRRPAGGGPALAFHTATG